MRVKWGVVILLVLCWATLAVGQITRSALPADILGIPTTASGAIYPITARTGPGSTCTAATLNAALAALGASQETLILPPNDGAMVPCTWTLEANVTIPANVHLVVAAPVAVNPGFTLAIHGPHQTLIGPNWYSGAGTVTFATNIPWGSAEIYRHVLNDFVIAGGLHGTSGSTTTPAFTTEALIQGRHVAQVDAQAVIYSDGDGTYFLGMRHNLAVTPGGWTCVVGTHYCWILSATPPATQSGTVLLLQATVSGAAITAVDPILPQPGGIYLPERYGAVGNGTDDDTAAFVAINAALPATGGVIQLRKAASYFINTAGGVTFTKSVTLQGMHGQSSTVACGATVGEDVGCVTLQGAQSTLQNFALTDARAEFTGENTATDLTATILVTATATDATMSNLHMTDARYAIRLVETTGATITHNTFVNTTHRSDNPPEPASAGFNDHVLIEGGSDHVVTDNWHDGGGSHLGVAGKVGGDAVATRVTYANNHGAFAWDACAYYAASVEGIISNNTCLNANFYSFKMRGNDNTMIGNVARNPTIACSGMAYIQGLAATQVAGFWGHRNKIIGNTFEAEDCGLGIDVGPVGADTPVRDTIISNNIVFVKGVGTAAAVAAGSEWGISLRGGHRGTLVANNYIIGNEVGIYTDDLGFADQTGTVIRGNTVVASNEIGIRVRRQAACDVQGNTVLDAGAAATSIVVDDSDDCTISDNNLQTATSTTVAISELNTPLRTHYRNNRWEGHSAAVPFVFNAGSGNSARLVSDDFLVEALIANTTISPGLYRLYQYTADAPRDINVTGQWPIMQITICNTDAADTLTFVPTTTALTPNTCGTFAWLGAAWRLVHN